MRAHLYFILKDLTIKLFFLVIILTALTGLKLKPVHLSEPIGAEEVLQKLSARINDIESVRYDYYRGLNYYSENFLNETSGSTYLNFVSNDKLIGFKYQLENNQYKMIYNGTESFYLDKKKKTVKVFNKPILTDFSSLPFLTNSFVTLRKSLPQIINDTEILKSSTDTSINGKKFHLLSIVLQNKSLNSLGTFDTVTLKRNFTYKIVVDKETYLPLHVIQTNNIDPKDFVLTSFSNFKINSYDPVEKSWYYSTYMNEYKPATEKVLNLIKQNAQAPKWRLPLYGSSQFLNLNELKGKVVLLEFWIKNCGYCIEAVPKLNSIADKYKKKHFQIVGINVNDAKEDVQNFYQKHKPDFKSVYDNGKVTNDYGVGAFPTVVLLNKNGVVLYSGDFDQERIEKLIGAALK